MNDKTTPHFATLIKEHANKGFHCAFRLTNNADNARELVQQTLAKALTHFSSYEQSRPFAPWFNQILKNIFLDGVRRIQYKRTVSLDGPSPVENVTWEQLIEGTDRTPLEQMEAAELSSLVQRALSVLPPVFKQVVTLCDVDRLSYQQIADIVDCPMGTVRSRVHQGRVLLRESFRLLTSGTTQFPYEYHLGH